MALFRCGTPAVQNLTIKRYAVGILMNTALFQQYDHFTVSTGCELKAATDEADTDGTLIQSLTANTVYDVANISVSSTYINFRTSSDIVVNLY